MLLKILDNMHVECACKSEIFFIKMLSADAETDGRDWNIAWVCALCDHHYDMQEFLGILAKSSKTRHGAGATTPPTKGAA